MNTKNVITVIFLINYSSIKIGLALFLYIYLIKAYNPTAPKDKSKLSFKNFLAIKNITIKIINLIYIVL